MFTGQHVSHDTPEGAGLEKQPPVSLTWYVCCHGNEQPCASVWLGGDVQCENWLFHFLTCLDDIGKLKLLRVFTLSNNSLKSLPTSVGGLLSLEELNLQWVQMDELAVDKSPCLSCSRVFTLVSQTNVDAVSSQFRVFTPKPIEHNLHS